MHRTAAPLLLALALTAAGCSSSGTAQPPTATASAPEPLTAQALTALAADRPATDLPPATQTTADAEAALAATLPSTSASVPGLDASAVKAALAFAAKVVAATRADRDFLCGPASASPVAALSTRDLQEFLADPSEAEAHQSLEVPISGAGNGEDCGPLEWAGPGVVLGPQEWTVLPGEDGADLTVQWEGALEYVLADQDGTPEPWGIAPVMRYRLARTDGGWALDSWRSWRSGISQGWPGGVPVPDGYLPVPDAPAGDPDALAAVRGAAAAWLGTVSSETAFAAASKDLGTATAADDDEATGLTAEVVAAPARGDATGTFASTGGDSDDAGKKAVWLDGGLRYLNEARSPPPPSSPRPRLAGPEHAENARLIAAAAGLGTAQNARHAAAAAADLLAWADRHGHVTQTPADVLAAAVINKWSAAADGAARWSTSTRRNRLRWIRHAAAVLRSDAVATARDHSRPYSRAEIDALRGWAEAKSGDSACDVLASALALALGTGLPSRDIIRATGADVRRDPATGAVTVIAGPPGNTREIPCLAEHEDDLLAAARVAGRRWLVDPEQTEPTTERLRLALDGPPPVPGVPRLLASRCRATWIRAQLASGTRLDTVLAAAGLSTPSGLQRWTGYLPAPAAPECRALLRDA